jgi:hypothetical protein
MANVDLESKHALVYMGLGDGAHGSDKRNKTNNGKSAAIRAFIDRDAFPSQAFREHQRGGGYIHTSNDAYIDSFSIPCYKTAYRHKSSSGSAPVPMPGFLNSERYLNRLSLPDAYHNFQSPHFFEGIDNQGPRYPDLVYGTHATSAVASGGVTQAVLRPGDQRVGDKIGYADHNVPCREVSKSSGELTFSGEAVAEWLFINANPSGRAIWTWVATKVPPKYTRSC